jgi:hypothetical protein
MACRLPGWHSRRQPQRRPCHPQLPSPWLVRGSLARPVHVVRYLPGLVRPAKSMAVDHADGCARKIATSLSCPAAAPSAFWSVACAGGVTEGLPALGGAARGWMRSVRCYLVASHWCCTVAGAE